MARPSVLERFESHITKSDRNCWLWDGEEDLDGIPRIYTGTDSKKMPRWETAARFAYKQFKSKLTSKEYLKKKCAFKKCVNPAHYEVSTHGQNSKLDDREVFEIVALSKKYGAKATSLASEYGVSRQQIYRILTRYAKRKSA